MPGKYTSSEEKARILAWRQEKVSIKEICARSRRAKSTVMKLLASAKGLPPNKVPKHRFGGGQKKKTSNATDTLIKREVQKNPRLTALELKNLHPEVLKMLPCTPYSIACKKAWACLVAKLLRSLS